MEKSKSRKIQSLNLLKLLGILLIFNSHIHELYPIAALATGGAVGNSVFFITSGYFTKAESGEVFWPSYWNKLKRIYLITWAGVLVQIVVQHEYLETFAQGFVTLIWPTAFWFGGALVFFNLFLYGLEKLHFRAHFGLYSAAMLALYALGYLLIVDKTQWSVETPGLDTLIGYFKCIQYFYIYSLGYFVRKKGPQPCNARRGILCVAVAALAFLVQVGFKLIMVRMPFFYNFQFISQICNIVFSLSLLLGFMALEDVYGHLAGGRLRSVVDSLGAISYEMYAVQFVVIAHCVGIPFPVNIAVALAVTTAAAFCVNRLVSAILRVTGRRTS